MMSSDQGAQGPFLATRRGRRWMLVSLGMVMAGAAGAVLLVNNPPGSEWAPGCLFHQATGLFCTGCGITRACFAMLHGDVVKAISMNPLAVLAAPVAIALWLHEGLGKPQKWEGVAKKFRDARVWMMVILTFTVARNIPWPPFSWLAPG